MSAQSISTPVLPEANPLLQAFQAACSSAGLAVMIPEPANSSIFRTTAK